jgi:hypothetical protein
MMDWSEVDGALLRESIKMAKPVRDSIEAQVNIDKIIDQWRSAYPETARPTTIEAREWANKNIAVNNTELNKGLGILYAIGWMFGRDVATSAYAHERLNKAAPTEEQLNGLLNIDWANWKPGNNPGALLASPPGGLKRLLKRRGLDLEGLTNTLLNRIGTALANALTSGATDTVLGKALEIIVGDPERALTIANTSMASAMSVSTLETYKEFDLAKMRWLALEPCETCSGNGALGPVNVGEAVFKNVQGDNITEPPAHPNCRCALAPVIDLDQFKYVNQARDDRGRWTSGGGSAGGFKTYDYAEKFFADNDPGNVFYDKADYKDRAAIEGYQNDGYIAVNNGLRSNATMLDPELQRNIDRIDHVIDVAPPLAKDTMLYRGFRGGSGVENLQVGSVLTDSAFTSTTADKGFAERWAKDGDKGYVMSIQAPAGTKGVIPKFASNSLYQTGSYFDYEAEFLMPRNTSMEIISINNTTRTIEAKIVNR